MMIPVGVTTRKNINPITIGEIILPRNKPNFSQIIFKGVKIFEFNNPKIKKIIDKIKDQILKSFPLKTGHKAMIKKTTKKMYLFSFSNLNECTIMKAHNSQKKTSSDCKKAIFHRLLLTFYIITNFMFLI